jgi:hypothetical protein
MSIALYVPSSLPTEKAKPIALTVESRVTAIARNTGASVAVVRTFAKISDKANAGKFSAKAAHAAFGHLRRAS